MQTFTIRDLRDRTGELVRTAEEGHLSVITKHGHPVFVAIPFNEALLSSGATVGMAVNLFKEHAVTLERASKMAGMPIQTFISCLGSMGIAVVDYDPSDLTKELEALDAE